MGNNTTSFLQHSFWFIDSLFVHFLGMRMHAMKENVHKVTYKITKQERILIKFLITSVSKIIKN